MISGTSSCPGVVLQLNKLYQYQHLSELVFTPSLAGERQGIFPTQLR